MSCVQQKLDKRKQQRLRLQSTCTLTLIYLTDESTNVLISNIDIRLRNYPTRLFWTIEWSHIQLLKDENPIAQRNIRGQPCASEEARRQERLPLQFSNKIAQAKPQQSQHGL